MEAKMGSNVGSNEETDLPTHVRIIPADVSRMEMRRKMRLTLLLR